MSATLFILLLVFSTHIFSIVFESFASGFTAAMLLLLVASGAELWRGRHTFPATRKKRLLRRELGRFFIIGSATVIVLAPMLFYFDIHDRIAEVGHFTFASQIVNGIYPPRFPHFPEQILKYHYGIDIIVAIVISIFRLRVDVAFAVVTVLLWINLLYLSRLVGTLHFGDKSGGLITVLAVIGAGGMPETCSYLIGERVPYSWLGYTETCVINSFVTNPPLVSYIFQPPLLVGLNLFLFSLIAFNRFCIRAESRDNEFIRFALVAVVTASIALFHIVIFLVIVCSATLSLLYLFSRDNKKIFLPALAVIIGALAATRLGGFFAPASAASDRSLLLAFNSGGIARELYSSLLWNLITLGPSLGLFIGYFIRNFRSTLRGGPGIKHQLFAIAVGSFIVFNCVHYKNSWDIVKFTTITSFCFAFFAAAFIDGLKSRIVKTLLIVALLSTPSLFILKFWSHIVNVAKNKSWTQPYYWRSLPENDRRAINFLRGQVSKTDLIYVRKSVSLEYMLWGGLNCAFHDNWASAAHGILQSRIDKRNQALESQSPGLLMADGVTIFVIDRENANLLDALKNMPTKVKPVFSSGDIEIFSKI